MKNLSELIRESILRGGSMRKIIRSIPLLRLPQIPRPSSVPEDAPTQKRLVISTENLKSIRISNKETYYPDSTSSGIVWTPSLKTLLEEDPAISCLPEFLGTVREILGGLQRVDISTRSKKPTTIEVVVVSDEDDDELSSLRFSVAGPLWTKLYPGSTSNLQISSRVPGGRLLRPHVWVGWKSIPVKSVPSALLDDCLIFLDEITRIINESANTPRA